VTGKIHIGRNGKPGKCTADPGNCPFGGSNEHFENEEQAYEAEYAGAGVALTKTNGQLGRPMPEFDHNTAKFSIFRMDEGAKPETKNKGEYSELHALATCLSDREMIFNAGSEPFEITAVQAKNHKYKIVDEDGEKAVYLQDPIGDVYSITTADDDRLNDLSNAISKGKKTFKSPTVQAECVRLGFLNGRIPKAPAGDKSDLSVWDENGKEHRLSIKSYLGHDPALMSASKGSEMTYEADLPDGMTQEDAESLVKETEEMSTKEKIKYLKNKGIEFDPDSGAPTHEKFKKNLESVDPDSQRAYSRGVFSIADSNTEMSDDLKEPFNKTIGAFSTRMTYTEKVPQGKEITDFMTINQNGRASIMNFEDDRQAGEYFSKRLTFSEPADSKFPSGKLNVKNGRISLLLNSNASISQVPRTKRDS